MAADKKAPIIVRRKKGGHAGAHGGAWKVAYADFVTAMMCFFMVMWLMGSDEEVKAAVESYFASPATAYRIDMASKDSMPLGDKTGAGDSILSGAQGDVPEDLVERPSRPIMEGNTNAESATDTVERIASSGDKVFVEALKFSVLEADVFVEQMAGASENNFTKDAPSIMAKIAELAKANPDSQLIIQTKMAPGESFDVKNQRLVEMSKFLIQKKWVSQNRIKTQVQRAPASDSKFEFSFERAQ